MQPERTADQAEGLRRLLARAGAKALTFYAAQSGMGTTSVVVNLAASLARTGKNVLVLDENLSHNNVSNRLALKARHDLLHAVRRDRTLQQVMLHRDPFLSVLPMARAMQLLPVMPWPERAGLLDCMAAAVSQSEIVLLDTVAGGHLSPPAGMLPDPLPVIILNPGAAAITGSYAMIKRMAIMDGHRNFGIVVNKVRDEREARALFANVSQACNAHLRVNAEYLGHVPLEDALRQSAHTRQPVAESCPDARSARLFHEMARNLAPLAAPEWQGDISPPGMRRNRVMQGQSRPGYAG